MPVEVIQVSSKVNSKELQQAMELCEELDVNIMTINAPRTLDFRTYNFLLANLRHYKHEGIQIQFAIINPNDSNLFALPIPKFRFRNIAEIVKKYNSKIGLDIANLDEEIFEMHLLKKMDKFIPHIAVIYLADKNKKGQDHITPGEGILKLPTLLEELKKNNYTNPISIKLTIEKKYLADNEKVELILARSKKYIQEKYIDLKL
jgi:sugar phosphate isomerase/epimerase